MAMNDDHAGITDPARNPNATHGSRLPSRRAFLSLGIGAFAVAALPGAWRRGASLTTRRFPIMGTIGEIAVVGRDERWARGAIDAAVRELWRVESLMTRFRDDSDIGRANRLAAARPVAVDPETALVLESALRWARATDGAFDPCLGRATALWDVGHRASPPPAAQVERFAGRRLFQRVETGSEAGRAVVVYGDPDAAIDLGGIAKGHGVDRAVDALRAWGVTDALVNLGGDLYAMGASADSDPWSVGVRDPADPDRLLATLPLADRAIATSGDYMQYFDHAGRRYHHLLDPRTGAPARSAVHSATVTADRCMDADAAATAILAGATGEGAADIELIHTA